MKAWRRSSRTPSTGTVVAAPFIVSVTVDAFNVVTVVFNTGVHWNGADAGTFQVNSNPGAWLAQPFGNILTYTPSIGVSSGDPWDWSGPDASLTPIPDPTDNGAVT